jgi:hypothetical protein
VEGQKKIRELWKNQVCGSEIKFSFETKLLRTVLVPNRNVFNVYVKSVLLYGCQTWLVTCEIQRKLQSFVNRCLRYIMKIWWSRVICNEKLWEMTGQININKEIRKRKFGWIGHTLRKDDSEPCKAALQWNPQGTRNSWRRTTLNESGKHSWSDLRFIARRFLDNICS